VREALNLTNSATGGVCDGDDALIDVVGDGPAEPGEEDLFDDIRGAHVVTRDDNITAENNNQH